MRVALHSRACISRQRMFALLAFFAIAVAGCKSGTETAVPSARDQELRAIAKEAYIYGFPMVDSYRIQYAYFVDQSGTEFKGAWNTIHSTARVFTPEDAAHRLRTVNSAELLGRRWTRRIVVFCFASTRRNGWA